jgi:hypothetical protein
LAYFCPPQTHRAELTGPRAILMPLLYPFFPASPHEPTNGSIGDARQAGQCLRCWSSIGAFPIHTARPRLASSTGAISWWRSGDAVHPQRGRSATAGVR